MNIFNAFERVGTLFDSTSQYSNNRKINAAIKKIQAVFRPLFRPISEPTSLPIDAALIASVKLIHDESSRINLSSFVVVIYSVSTVKCQHDASLVKPITGSYGSCTLVRGGRRPADLSKIARYGCNVSSYCPQN